MQDIGIERSCNQSSHSHPTERPSVNDDAIPCIDLCGCIMDYDAIPCGIWGAAIPKRAQSTLIPRNYSERTMTLPHAASKNHARENDVNPCVQAAFDNLCTAARHFRHVNSQWGIYDVNPCKTGDPPLFRTVTLSRALIRQVGHYYDVTPCIRRVRLLPFNITKLQCHSKNTHGLKPAASSLSKVGV